MPVFYADLEYHYFFAPAHQRRFLTSTHYRIATEVAATGSMYWNWCSLCKKTHTFTSEKMENRHYFQSHSFIAHLYTCPICKYAMNLPTEYRDHMWICDPIRAADLRLDVMPFVLDAYADYVALHGKGNHPLFLIQPGHPLMRLTGTAPRPTHRRGERSAPSVSIEMNRTTMRPTDVRTNIITSIISHLLKDTQIFIEGYFNFRQTFLWCQ